MYALRMGCLGIRGERHGIWCGCGFGYEATSEGGRPGPYCIRSPWTAIVLYNARSHTRTVVVNVTFIPRYVSVLLPIVEWQNEVETGATVLSQPITLKVIAYL